MSGEQKSPYRVDALSVLRRALDAVEALHSEGVVAGESRCNACSAPERGYVVPYPCPTQRAIWDAQTSRQNEHDAPVEPPC